MVFSVDVWVQKGDVLTWCRLEQDLHGPRKLASPGAADLRPLPGETDTAVVNVDDDSMNTETVWSQYTSCQSAGS